jgi:CRP/FNR family transcriptional regulator
MSSQMLLSRRAINLADAAIPELCAGCEARHIGLCDALPDEDLHFLASVARKQTIPKGRGFIEEGDPARHFFNLNHGAVKLFKSLPDGRRQITGFMGAGDFLGLAAGQTYCFSAEALDEVRLCRFDRMELRQVFGAFPLLERRLLDVASHELVAAQEQMLLLGRKTALERFASFLLAWSGRSGPCAADSKLALPMTRADLADYLGMTFETVSRSISALKRRKLIDTDAAHHITILDPVGLEQVTAD